MKSYCLIFPALFLTFHCSAKVINGYERDIESVRRSLNGLQELLKKNITLLPSEKRGIQAKMESMIDFISCYEVTNKMLAEFRTIAPDLFDEIDHVEDIHGRATDVYVRLVPKKEARVQAAGTTCLAHAADDHDLYSSEFGVGTISVKVWIVSKALWVLAHEFGHVKYQVPNLKSYVEFHKHNYTGRSADPNHVGHNPNDPSGKSALAFEKRFREHLTADYRNSHRSESPVLLLEAIRKQVRDKEMISARR